MSRTDVTLKAHIERAVSSADFIIADITGNNPNVMYELGFAMATGKNVIIISQDVHKAPSNLAGYLILQYDKRHWERFTMDLSKRIILIVSQLEAEREQRAGSQVSELKEQSLSAESTSIGSLVANTKERLFVMAESPSAFADLIATEVRAPSAYGVIVRMMFPDPEGIFTGIRAQNLGINKTHYRQKAWDGIKKLTNRFSTIQGIHMELRLVDIVNTPIYIIDDIVIITPYFAELSTRESLNFAISKQSSRIFLRAFNRAWHQAKLAEIGE